MLKTLLPIVIASVAAAIIALLAYAAFKPDMDKTVGKNFAAGLANLKALAEKT